MQNHLEFLHSENTDLAEWAENITFNFHLVNEIRNMSMALSKWDTHNSHIFYLTNSKFLKRLHMTNTGIITPFYHMNVNEDFWKELNHKPNQSFTDDKVHPNAFVVDNAQLYISTARIKFGHFVRWDLDENWKLSVQL